jgi:Protein of unknown function (DUF2889)
MPTRRHVHTRSISADVYVRDDGLWDVEAELIDTKGRDFMLATGLRKQGEPIHHMRMTVTIDEHFNVVEAKGDSLRAPYLGECKTVESAYGQLVGLNLLKGFRHAVRERLGGTRGCTHLTELTNVLPTAAVQAFAGEVLRTNDNADPSAAQDETMPWQLDRCRALRVDGPAVAQFYPRWYRPTTSATPSASNAASIDSTERATPVADEQ